MRHLLLRALTSNQNESKQESRRTAREAWTPVSSVIPKNLAHLNRIINQGSDPEFVGMSIGFRSVCFCKMDVSSVGYRDGGGGGAGKFVEMSVEGVGTEGDPVDMASHEWNCFSGNGCEAVIVGVLAAFRNKGAAYDFMNMLFWTCGAVGFHCCDIVCITYNSNPFLVSVMVVYGQDSKSVNPEAEETQEIRRKEAVCGRAETRDLISQAEEFPMPKQRI